MQEVVGITFVENGQVYYFLPNGYRLKKNVTVLVRTEKGLQFGKVVLEQRQLDSNQIHGELKKVLRIASKDDYYNHIRNLKDAKVALKKCRELAMKKKIPMQVIDAYYTFDREQLMFRFLADNRVDFRELVKDLAAIYKTRIELRQVGVRDKAKAVGGCGLCGEKLCCARFLKDLDSVSINMAKNQNISLNPSKINGVCGRLLCCLKYENECYKECKQNLPTIGKKIETPKGRGTVIAVDILKRRYMVSIPEIGLEEFEVKDGSC